MLIELDAVILEGPPLGSVCYLVHHSFLLSVKRQTTVSKSSAKAKYRSMFFATNEVLWFRHLLHELGVLVTGPTPLNIDNINAIYVANNPIFHKQSKHNEVNYHFNPSKFYLK